MPEPGMATRGKIPDRDFPGQRNFLFWLRVYPMYDRTAENALKVRK